MGRKVYKTIKDDDKTIVIWGSNRNIKIRYAVPDWQEDGELEQYFMYEGRRNYLSTFEDLHNIVHRPHVSDWLKEFHGIHHDSFFSGVLIKWGSEEETVKAFTYCV